MSTPVFRNADSGTAQPVDPQNDAAGGINKSGSPVDPKTEKSEYVVWHLSSDNRGPDPNIGPFDIDDVSSGVSRGEWKKVKTMMSKDKNDDFVWPFDDKPKNKNRRKIAIFFSAFFLLLCVTGVVLYFTVFKNKETDDRANGEDVDEAFQGISQILQNKKDPGGDGANPVLPPDDEVLDEDSSDPPGPGGPPVKKKSSKYHLGKKIFGTVINAMTSINVKNPAAAKSLREWKDKWPKLFRKNEKVEYMFESARDRLFFTNYRIIIADVKGLTTSATAKHLYSSSELQSIGYRSVQSWSWRSGYGAIGDSFQLWASGNSVIKVKLVDKADQELQKFLTARVASFKTNRGEAVDAKDLISKAISNSQGVEYQTPKKDVSKKGVLGFVSGLFNMAKGAVTDDYEEIDAASTSQYLTKKNVNVLAEDEIIDFAFKCGRDLVLFTSFRFMIIDIEITSKMVYFQSFAWKSFKMFTMKYAGIVDLDNDLILYTSVAGNEYIPIDLGRGIGELNRRIFADYLMMKVRCVKRDMDGNGNETKVYQQIAPATGHHYLSNKLAVRSGRFQIMDRTKDQSLQQFLSPGEEIDSAYICDSSDLKSFLLTGIKHKRMLVFTQMRLLYIEAALVGTRDQILSLPWTSIQGFAIKTPKRLIDLDWELNIWTSINWAGKKGKKGRKKNKQIHDIYEQRSFMEFDFMKGEDYRNINRIFASRLPAANLVHGKIAPPTAISNLNPVDWIQRFSGNAAEVDAESVTKELKEDSVLANEEVVWRAHKETLDLMIFTNLRLILIDKSIVKGCQSFQSWPWSSIVEFTFNPKANLLDPDSKLEMEFKIYWGIDGKEKGPRKLEQEMSGSEERGNQLQSDLAKLLLQVNPGDQPAPKIDTAADANVAKQALTYLFAISSKMSAEDAEKKLGPVLIENEKVEHALKDDFDFVAFTNYRVISIKKKKMGLYGKTISSLPLRFCKAYSVEMNSPTFSGWSVHMSGWAKGLNKRKVVSNEAAMEVNEYFTRHLLLDDNKVGTT